MSDVHVGRGGWLFLVGGSNDVLSLFTDESQFSEHQAREWCSEIQHRIFIANDIGAKYLHVVAPEKIRIYQEKTDISFPDTFAGPAARVGQMLKRSGDQASFLDLTEILVKYAGSSQLYMKTDTHWTYEGIYLIYKEICARLDILPSISEAERERVLYKGIFDLGGKLCPPIEEENIHLPFLPGIKRVFANRIAEMWDEAAANKSPVKIHNSLHVIYRNDRPDALNRKVVLFGDSFIDFRPTTLSSLFIEQFRETHIVWSGSVDEAYIRKIKPHILITENAERFMREIPSRYYRIDEDTSKRLCELESRK